MPRKPWTAEEQRERDRHLDAGIDKAITSSLTKTDHDKIAEAVVTAYDPRVVGSHFRFKARVVRNFYKNQSTAWVKLWTPGGWKFVHGKDWPAMHAVRLVHPGGTISQDEARAFRRDMRDLLDVAEKVTGYVLEELAE